MSTEEIPDRKTVFLYSSPGGVMFHAIDPNRPDVIAGMAAPDHIENFE